MKTGFRYLLPALLLGVLLQALRAETSPVPDWAQPGSATHKQVPPPADYHRASTNFDAPLGIFTGQSDIGSAVVSGSASFDPKKKQYTINSAGYNIWYTRDEFRFLWKKMSGDISLASDIAFPNAGGYGDRKVVLIVRQDLDDDAKEIMVALHGAGLVHLAQRPEKGANIKENVRIEGSAENPGAANAKARLGLEKTGDTFTLFASLKGEPMHQIGFAILHVDGPFYVGVGFTSHLPATSDTAVVSNVALENVSGKIH